ncbi:MAG: IPT/TIG domain-containing protein [Candidatus Cryptobacteroides sp.]
MKRFFITAVSVLALSALYSCEQKIEPVPIAPIILDVVMPAESQAMPGTVITVKGLGFSKEDVITCKSKAGEEDFVAEITEVTNYDVSFRIPESAGGEYELVVTRNELSTVLPATLKVPFVVLLKNVVMPSGVLKRGSAITIEGEGFEEGDVLRFESAAYPSGASFSVNATCTDKGLSCTLPKGVYSVNSVTVVRGERINNLGNISVAVDKFSKVSGGYAFYLSDNGVHGLVVYPAAIGGAAVNWGPSVPQEKSAGTSPDIYKGKSNTAALVKQAADTRNDYSYEHDTPAEACAKLSLKDGDLTYTDWFLPSQNELIELFKVKADVAAAGFAIPANNYWCSTEFNDGGSWIWAQYYVNFYEATNVVSAGCDRIGWAIGTLAVRQF